MTSKNKLVLVLIVLFSVPMFLSAQGKKKQKIEISGSVTDFNNKPIRKAIIFVDSIETLTKTNNKGIYRFKTKNDIKSIAVFASNHGMLIQEVISQKAVNFVFPEEAPVIQKDDLAALGFKLFGDKSDRYKGYDSIFDLIKTEFTGVTVRGGAIKIRGSAVLMGSATALLIVDGSYVNSIGFINPVEIKSVEILKGEDTSLYGARGAHGVVIIELIK